MNTTLPAAVERYLKAKPLSRGTRNEYRSTLRKWDQWGGGVPIRNLQRKHVRESLDWVYERAVAGRGTNPGRTANKAREHLRAVLSWAWEQELIDALPRFPAVARLWRKWLSRRSWKGRFGWANLWGLLERMPLPAARVVHAVYRRV
jgi:hypothetical protein